MALWVAACASAPLAPDDTADTARPWVNPCDAIRAGAPRLSCTSGIRGSPYPSNGMTGVALEPTFVLDFITDERESSCVELAGGGDVPALAPTTWTEDGRSMWFRPLTPLQPDTDYTLTVHYSCDKSAPIAFRTAPAAGPVDGSALLGAAFALDPSSSRLLGPREYAFVLASLLEDAWPVFVPTAHDPALGRLEGFHTTTGVDGVQDVCATTPPFALDLDEADGAFASVSPIAFDLPLEGGVMHLRDASLSATFLPDGSAMIGVEIEGSLDVRDADPEAGGPVAICEAVADWSSGAQPCGPCPGDDGDFCVPFHLVNGVATVQPWSIVPIDRAAVEANPECAVDGASAP